MAQRFNILGGPAKYEMSVSLLFGSCTKRQKVEFSVQVHEGQPVQTLEIMLNGMEREDGSSDRWLFSGYANLEGETQSARVVGYYDVRRRKGWIDME